MLCCYTADGCLSSCIQLPIVAPWRPIQTGTNDLVPLQRVSMYLKTKVCYEAWMVRPRPHHALMQHKVASERCTDPGTASVRLPFASISVGKAHLDALQDGDVLRRRVVALSEMLCCRACCQVHSAGLETLLGAPSAQHRGLQIACRHGPMARTAYVTRWTQKVSGTSASHDPAGDLAQGSSFQRLGKGSNLYSPCV